MFKVLFCLCSIYSFAFSQTFNVLEVDFLSPTQRVNNTIDLTSKQAVYYQKAIERLDLQLSSDSSYCHVIFELDTLAYLFHTLYIKLQNNTNDTLNVGRSFTNDPHFICGFPNDLITPNQEFYVKICFETKRYGPMRKKMGLTFTDGRRLVFYFKGFVQPLNKS